MRLGGPRIESQRTWYERRERRLFTLRLSPLLVFVGLFFLVPLGALFAYSLGSTTFVDVKLGTSFHNYATAFGDTFYLRLFGRAIVNGLLVAVFCVLLGYPFAYAVTLGPLRRRGELFLLWMLISLFASYIVRVYAWRTLLGSSGILNTALGYVGLGPWNFLIFNRISVVLTLVNVLVPLAVLPIYSALHQVDASLLEAARDQGATARQALQKVILPLSQRGITAGFALCFVLAAGDYVTPQLVGGVSGQQIGNVISDKFGVSFNWPLGAALSFVLILFMGAVVALWVAAPRAPRLLRLGRAA